MSTKTFEQWVRTQLDKYQKVLLLHDHTIYLEYKDLRASDMFEVSVRYPYKDVNVYYGPTALKEFKEKNHGELRVSVIHELVHVIVDPLYFIGVERYTTQDQLNNERERAVDHIAKVIAGMV